MADFTYNNSQTLTPAQIAALWQQVGAPPSIAHAFGYGVNPSEGGNRTGVVLNTAYPSLPAYTPPGAGASPEYSVGLYGLNIFGDISPTPSAQEAYTIGQNLAANPLYQTQIAAGMFNQRGFQPWTDSYVNAAGGPSALLSSLGYSSPPQIPNAVPFTGFVPSVKGNPLTGGKGGFTGNDTGAATPGLGPISPSNPNGLLNPGLATESSSGGSWFGLGGTGSSFLGVASTTWGKVLGGAIAVGGALGMLAGVFLLFKSETGIAALGRALARSNSSAGSTDLGTAPAPPEEVTQPVADATPPTPPTPPTPEISEDDYDMDEVLRAYYAGVEAGQAAPRTSRKTVGVYHDADEGEF